MAASDLEKLKALCALGSKLTEWEQDAFPRMLERLTPPKPTKLSSRQHEAVDYAYLRYDLDADEPAENLVSSGVVAKSTTTVFPFELLPRPKSPPGRKVQEEPVEQKPVLPTKG